MPGHHYHDHRSRRPIDTSEAGPAPRKPRLHRLEHTFVEDAIYFVTCCVQPRQPALDDDRVHRAFVAFCNEGIARGSRVGRYVLMPDHIHVFVAFSRPDDDAAPSLSDWAKAMKGCISKAWRETGCSGVHWQKGFFDHVLRSWDSYAQKWDYVLQNPVRAGLVSQPEDWPYSGEICHLDARL